MLYDGYRFEEANRGGQRPLPTETKMKKANSDSRKRAAHWAAKRTDARAARREEIAAQTSEYVKRQDAKKSAKAEQTGLGTIVRNTSIKYPGKNVWLEAGEPGQTYTIRVSGTRSAKTPVGYRDGLRIDDTVTDPTES